LWCIPSETVLQLKERSIILLPGFCYYCLGSSFLTSDLRNATFPYIKEKPELSELSSDENEEEEEEEEDDSTQDK
jgi:hypothetical protein